MTQFNELIHALSRRLNWDTQMAALPAGNKPKKETFPLSPDRDRKRRISRGRGVKKANTQRVAETFDSFEKRMRSFVGR